MDAWIFDESAPLDIKRPAAGQRREVYGRIYELITGDPRDGAHPYVGMTEGTIHQRVHGSRGHTSPESIAKDPWKAHILPGRAGYRQLEVVYATGNPMEDDRSLRRAEAYWIDQLRTTYNKVRPVRPPVHERVVLPRRAVRVAVKRSPAQIRAARRTRLRVLAFLALTAVFAFLSARLVLAMHLPWPQVPWITAPIVGIALGWIAFEWLDRKYRRLTRGRR